MLGTHMAALVFNVLRHCSKAFYNHEHEDSHVNMTSATKSLAPFKYDARYDEIITGTGKSNPGGKEKWESVCCPPSSPVCDLSRRHKS